MLTCLRHWRTEFAPAPWTRWWASGTFWVLTALCGESFRRARYPTWYFTVPLGVGKTTVASIIAQNTRRHLVKLNGTTASTADIKEAVASTRTFEGINGVLLYLDEIQYFNKNQQQTLLELWKTALSR